ncbi:MAG: acyloxyacyl hydrolase [Desulfobacter sp.]|nr:acyloxyacyl hydrolase [Desulfobacter sp.]WDP85688.1 MAG: acyloxyacyl hydrolase [Desulfobacter sp.]
MKKSIFVLICLVFLSSSVMAQDSSGFGLSLGYGQSQDNVDIYRIGLVKKWGVTWLKNSTGYLDGYFELSYNHWDGGDKNINAVALSPVFLYAFNPNDSNWYPYIEGGIGIAYLDEYFIKDRNLSSNLQFEDRIGLGLRYDNFDLSARYMHYSNASLKQPNNGIDIFIGSLAWYF